MDREITAVLEKLLGRELGNEEKERLQRIQDTLGIGPNDALWAIIAAMEYPRLYYEELPEKIRAVTAQIFDDIAAVSEKEVALAQSRLTESVVKQAESLSLKRHIHTWLVWGTATLFLLLLYGTFLLWAGFCLGAGRVQVHGSLRMPVGVLLAAISICCGIFSGALAAKNFAEGLRQWRRLLLVAVACLISGSCLAAFTLI